MANNVYSSAEYQSLGYTNTQKVLTLYRGILSREPDAVSSVQYWVSLLNAGHPMSTLVSNLVTQAEFYTLRDTQICAAVAPGAETVYRWGMLPVLRITPGETPIEVDDVGGVKGLQHMLNDAASAADKTVRLPQGSVIYAAKEIIVPAGVTLTTVGNVPPNQYAKMARIVRTANTGTTILTLQGGASVNGIWVSGQRNHIINGQQLQYMTMDASLKIAHGTANASVIGSRFDTANGNTNIAISGYSDATSTSCNGHTVQNNLITGYTDTHRTNIASRYTDGITNQCRNATVSGNGIVDVSDVGVVTFADYILSGGVKTSQQASVVSNNTVIAAGSSTIAAYSFEPYEVAKDANGNPLEQIKNLNFTNATFSGNRFWTGPGAHFDFGVAGSGKPWHGIYGHLGYGAKIINNTNEGIATNMQIGIAIDGMSNTTVSNNALRYVTLAVEGLCPTKAAIVADTGSELTQSGTVPLSTPGLITGNTQNGVAVSYTVGSVDNCQPGNH
ncbi:DUF4214 domain-containing protein [Massilia endophytica]|uniref:DUF4214 domain-containing protein n=1 Tax=Massilia endophytica TaxID=2899220 RepID=UPI001E2A2291|nr:DUF4214 domain-containing protein [Massilia endophytica]UGQ49160.1 DUF4214 domain-containing protein [Massilia endophytica]